MLDEAKRGRPKVNPDTGEDEKEHIIMQLRKAVSLNGKKVVEFDNGDSVPVKASHARIALSKHFKKRTAFEKSDYQNKLSKSHGSFKAALKESWGSGDDLQELSNKTLRSYVGKAARDISSQSRRAMGRYRTNLVVGNGNQDPKDEFDKDMSRVTKRINGVDLAAKKMSTHPSTKRYHAMKKRKAAMKEERDLDLQELSNKTLRSYVGKATRSAVKRARYDNPAIKVPATDRTPADIKIEKTRKKISNRIDGIDLATKKMSTHPSTKRYHAMKKRKAAMKEERELNLQEAGMPDKYAHVKKHLKTVGKDGAVTYFDTEKRRHANGRYGGLKRVGGHTYALVHHNDKTSMAVPLNQVHIAGGVGKTPGK